MRALAAAAAGLEAASRRNSTATYSRATSTPAASTHDGAVRWRETQPRQTAGVCPAPHSPPHLLAHCDCARRRRFASRAASAHCWRLRLMSLPIMRAARLLHTRRMRTSFSAHSAHATKRDTKLSYGGCSAVSCKKREESQGPGGIAGRS